MTKVRSVFRQQFLKRQDFFILVLCALLICLMGFWWGYSLDILPGLHADEAWSGLKAIHFERNHIDQTTGMNNYTGILQALIAELFFELFGLGVWQLRIGGVLLNVMGLVILTFSISAKNKRTRGVIFLLIMGLSSLFMVYPRVAWEVNSLTLFLFSVSFASFFRIIQAFDKAKPLWIFVFLLSNFLGTYNHILFSCISVSLFAGTIFWELRYRSGQHEHLIVLLGINCVNLIIIFLTMRYNPGQVMHTIGYLSLFALVLLFGSTSAFFQLTSSTWKYHIRLKINKRFSNGILAFAVITFIAFHGTAFFEVLSSCKIILQVFSYESSPMTEVTLALVGATVLTGFSIQLIKDMKCETTPIETYWIIFYLGLFCVYTISCSYRYYLALYLIMAVYMTYRSSMKHLLVSRLLLISGIAGFLVLQVLLFDIFIVGNFPMKATDFKIGNGQKETTSHFLPKEPVTDFLRSTKTGQIQYLIEEPYFVEEPIWFYKEVKPWVEKKDIKVFLDYDHTKYNTGFLLYKGAK